jgi:hypothetical protein
MKQIPSMPKREKEKMLAKTKMGVLDSSSLELVNVST